ncbi:MAG TPA: DNA gyrase modulator, partial [Clostridia bacterium]|nr:DNA gyrase modulator [Clostridia bacterium]
MEFNAFKKALFEEALARGCEAAEAYYQRTESFSVNVLEGDIDQYEVNAKGGLNLRVKLNGRNGYAFTQKLEEPEKLVARAMDNARSIEVEDDHPMQGKCEYPVVIEEEKKAYALGEQQKIDLALSLERAAKAADPRVLRTVFCTVDSGRQEARISNTLGLDAAEEKRIAVSVVMPVTKEGEDMRNAYAFRFGDGVFDVD